MATPLLDHIDTAIKDLNNLKSASQDKDLNDKDRKKFLNIFLTKTKQQISMIELYLK